MNNTTASSWLEVDIIGLRRTLERKGKAWAIFELVQNSWDTDATQVEVTLSKPNENGISTLTCRDNAPDGYRDLSEAHTLLRPIWRVSKNQKLVRIVSAVLGLMILLLWYSER